MSQDSKFMKFVERQEHKRKPRPGVWVFCGVVWAVIAVATLVAFLAFRTTSGGRDWFLLFFVIAGMVIVPLTVWRIRRDRRRLASWGKQVRA